MKKISLIVISLLMMTSILLPMAGAQEGGQSSQDQAPATRRQAAVLALTLYENLGGKVGTAGANPFTDVNDPALTRAYYAGIVSGVGGGKFNPGAAVTRQEAAVMLHRVLTLLEDNSFRASGTASFADAHQIADWAKASVSYLREAGVMKADAQNRIQAQKALTMGEMLSLIDSAGSFMAPTLCAKLEGMKIPASQIGLPTTGATVNTATLVLATDEGNVDGEYCKVLVSIHPVDKTAPDINFLLKMPTKWNQKVIHFGGGGFNGTVIGDYFQWILQPAAAPSAVARGFVAFGSDGGHKGTGNWDAKFGLNDEALRNFAGEELKKTKDTALALVQARYGKTPEQVYFFGGSEGGREAMMAVQRYPQDYDGVIAIFPVINWIPKALLDNRNANFTYADNGVGMISPEQSDFIDRTVLDACDELDGLRDGIVGNVIACEKKAEEILNTLSCPSGIVESSLCLSEAQMETLKLHLSPMEFDFPLSNGFRLMQGYTMLQHAQIKRLMGTSPTARDGIMAGFSDGVIRYMIVRDANFNPATFNPEEWKDEILIASQLLDATNPDISAFRDRGGKLLLFHGTSDDAVTYKGSVDYYQQLVDRFGQQSLDEFVKFYLIPGFGHAIGYSFEAGVDAISALDAWVVQGKEPQNLIAVDELPGSNGRTRPVCEYPSYPKYKGSGDVNIASSFICVAP